MPTKIRGIPGKKRRIIAALRDGHPATWIARSLNLSRSELYRWRSEDPAFAREWDDAVIEGNELLEEEARRRAVDGYNERAIFNRDGETVATIKDYSDKLLMLLLRVRNPKVFNPRPDDEVGQQTMVLNHVDAAQTLPQAMELYRALIRGDNPHLLTDRTLVLPVLKDVK